MHHLYTLADARLNKEFTRSTYVLSPASRSYSILFGSAHLCLSLRMLKLLLLPSETGDPVDVITKDRSHEYDLTQVRLRVPLIFAASDGGLRPPIILQSDFHH